MISCERARTLSARLEAGEADDALDHALDPAARCADCASTLRELRAWPFGCRAPRLGHAVLCQLDRLVDARPDAAGPELAAHLRECPACQAEVAEAQLALLGCAPDALRAPPAPRVLPGVSLLCVYCRDAVLRLDAAFCAACMAVHHPDCFEEHGRCCAPGCGSVETVRASAATGRRGSRRWRVVALGALLGVSGAAAVAALAWQGREAEAQRAALREQLEADAQKRAALREQLEADAQQRAAVLFHELDRLRRSVPPGQPAPPPAQLRVAVVDIGRLFAGYHRREELEREVNARREEIQAELTAERGRIDELERRLRTLRERDLLHPDIVRLEGEVRALRERLPGVEATRQAELKERVERLTLQLLREIEGAVKVHRERHGFDLVLKVDRGGGGDLTEGIFRAQVNNVVDFRDALDVTEAVLAELNAAAPAQRAEATAVGTPDDLLRAAEEAKAAGQHRLWHERAVALLRAHPRSPESGRVELPLLVTTEPGGRDVVVNGVLQGRTPDGGPLLCTFLPTERLRVEVRGARAPRPGEVEPPLLWSQTFDDPWTWRELRVPLLDEPDATAVLDDPVDQPLVHWGGAWAGATRGGEVVWLEVQRGERPTLVRAGGPEARLGERGDTVTAPLLHDGRLFVGLPDGLMTVDLREVPMRPSRQRTDGPIVARPVVCGEHLVFASLHGEVVGRPLGASGAEWTLRTTGGVAHDLLVVPGEGGRVLLAADDARLYAVETTGRIVWTHEAPAPLDGPPLLVPGGVGVPLQDGALLVLDPATGAARARVWVDPERRRIVVVADQERLVVARHDGAVRALDPRTLRPTWPADFVRSTAVRPRLCLVGDQVVVAGEEAGSAALWSVDLATGRLAWQARLPAESGRVLSLASDGEHLLLVTTSRGQVHLFDAEAHGP